LGEATQALAALEKSLSQAEPEGYIQVFVDEGILMQMLLAQGWQLPAPVPCGITPSTCSPNSMLNRSRGTRESLPGWQFDRAIKPTGAGSIKSNRGGILKPPDC